MRTIYCMYQSSLAYVNASGWALKPDVMYKLCGKQLLTEGHWPFLIHVCKNKIKDCFYLCPLPKGIWLQAHTSGRKTTSSKIHITQEQQSASHLFPDLTEALQWSSGLEELLAVGILISRARILFSLGRNLFGAASTGNFFSKWQQLWWWLGLQAQMHILIETGSSASTALTALQLRYCNRASV